MRWPSADRTASRKLSNARIFSNNRSWKFLEHSDENGPSSDIFFNKKRNFTQSTFDAQRSCDETNCCSLLVQRFTCFEVSLVEIRPMLWWWLLLPQPFTQLAHNSNTTQIRSIRCVCVWNCCSAATWKVLKLKLQAMTDTINLPYQRRFQLTHTIITVFYLQTGIVASNKARAKFNFTGIKWLNSSDWLICADKMDDIVYDIEEIISHRKRPDGKYEYFVKWKVNLISHDLILCFVVVHIFVACIKNVVS